MKLIQRIKAWQRNDTTEATILTMCVEKQSEKIEDIEYLTWSLNAWTYETNGWESEF